MLSTAAIVGGLATGYILTDYYVGTTTGVLSLSNATKELARVKMEALMQNIKLASIIQTLLVACFFGPD